MLATITHPLRTAAEYDAAVAEVDRLLELEESRRSGSAAYDRLDLLSVLVKDYEDAHLPMVPLPSPQAFIEFALEQRGLTRADLVPYMGGRGRVSDFFTGRRSKLSTNQIISLRDFLGISADHLIGNAE